MNTIPAQEIKRRGISATDSALKKGPVHIIKNNTPQYVVLTERQYSTLKEAEQTAYVARVKTSLEELSAGQVTRGSAEKLIQELGLDE